MAWRFSTHSNVSSQRNHRIKLICSDETKKRVNVSQIGWAKEMLVDIMLGPFSSNFSIKVLLRIPVQLFWSQNTHTVALFRSKYSYNGMLTLLEKRYSINGKNRVSYSLSNDQHIQNKLKRDKWCK